MKSNSPTPEPSSKREIYQALIPQIDFSFSRENDLVANLANAVAVLKSTTLPFFWVGFYLVKGDELVLGPFQGLPATTRIAFGAGVCGTAWKREKTQLVPDVDLFEGHIACNCFSQSEIVVPVFSEGRIVAVLDVDSDRKNDFDETDAECLEELAAIIGDYWKSQSR